jgi:multiple sugar transport system substrate-binding protein
MLDGHDEQVARPSRRAFLRQLSQAAVAVASGAVLTACGIPFSPSPVTKRPVSLPTPDKVQLVYQDWRTPWYPALAKELLELFHANHPNIHVFYVPDPEDVEERMLSDMRSGTAADVFQGCCTHFPLWAQAGNTLDLRPFIVADLDAATIADWDPAQFKALSLRNGHQFGLPKYHGALALYYNKDIFDQNGLDYPDATWDHVRYQKTMSRLTEDRIRDGMRVQWGSMVDISWDRLQVHVNGWGGTFVDPQDPYLCRMGEPAALAAFEWLRARMWDDRVMPAPLEIGRMSTTEAFLAGKLAMVEDGSWALKDILSGARFRVGVAPLPAGPNRRVTLATTDGIGIYAGTRYPEAAWELAKFLTGREAGLMLAKAHFLQPARVSLIDEWIALVREQMPERTKDMELDAFADGQRQGYSVTAEIFPNMEDARRLANAAWDQIFVYGEAPVTIMQDVSQRIQSAQTANRSQAGVPGAERGETAVGLDCRSCLAPSRS